jgi:hypothetical protein
MKKCCITTLNRVRFTNIPTNDYFYDEFCNFFVKIGERHAVMVAASEKNFNTLSTVVYRSRLRFKNNSIVLVAKKGILNVNIIAVPRKESKPLHQVGTKEIFAHRAVSNKIVLTFNFMQRERFTRSIVLKRNSAYEIVVNEQDEKILAPVTLCDVTYIEPYIS